MDVQKVAKLARLELTADEAARFAAQLEGVLAYIDQLRAVDTEGVEPLISPLEPVETPLAPDAVKPSPGAAAMTSISADSTGDQFDVPPVMGGAP